VIECEIFARLTIAFLYWVEDIGTPLPNNTPINQESQSQLDQTNSQTQKFNTTLYHFKIHITIKYFRKFLKSWYFDCRFDLKTLTSMIEVTFSAPDQLIKLAIDIFSTINYTSCSLIHETY
jgi:hypothetical protein